MTTGGPEPNLKLMVTNVYSIVAPFVLLLIIAEFVYCLIKKNGYYSFQDSVIGLGTMLIAQCVNLAVSVAVILAYGWIYQNWAILHFEPHWYHYVLCYIAVDFLFYWFHRAGHRVNLFWAAHVPHHSAEELNYAVGLRASLTQRAFSFLFYWPLAILGFSPDVILPVVAINLVYQLLPHTQVIGRFPRWIESWLNTPYHHRMHHALNPIYWDKNYGGNLIIWDKLFGSYVDETERPYYGVSVHPQSWDPTYLNFHWFIVIWKDMCATRRWSDKLKIWFMPPGWRPADLAPFEKKDGPGLPKYRMPSTPALNAFLIAQVASNFLLVLFLMNQQKILTAIDSILLSLAIWWSVTNWAALLEQRSWAKKSEWIRNFVTASILMMLIQRYELSESWGLLSIAIAVINVIWTFRLDVGNRTSAL